MEETVALEIVDEDINDFQSYCLFQLRWHFWLSNKTNLMHATNLKEIEVDLFCVCILLFVDTKEEMLHVDHDAQHPIYLLLCDIFQMRYVRRYQKRKEWFEEHQNMKYQNKNIPGKDSDNTTHQGSLPPHMVSSDGFYKYYNNGLERYLYEHLTDECITR